MSLKPTSLMPHGKYKGMQMQDVPPDYMLEITSQRWSKERYPDLIKYVEENRDELEKPPLIKPTQAMRHFTKEKTTTQKLNPKV